MNWISAAFSIGKGVYQAYKIWFLLVPLALLLAGIWLYVRSAENAKEELAVVNHKLGQALYTLQANEQALTDCKLVNQANQIQAELMADRVRKAELKLAAANATADAEVENIEREESELRASGLDCPAIDRSFRVWLRGSP